MKPEEDISPYLGYFRIAKYMHAQEVTTLVVCTFFHNTNC